MRGAPSEDVLPEEGTADEPQRRQPPARAASVGTQPAPEPLAPTFATATHEVLFAPSEPRCDVCDRLLADDEDGEPSDDDDSEGGHGLYVWVRHGAVVYEEPPLCASCASAITISALQRWDIEEEEG